jgi:hypothetical protein
LDCVVSYTNPSATRRRPVNAAAKAWPISRLRALDPGCISGRDSITDAWRLTRNVEADDDRAARGAVVRRAVSS